MDLTFDPDTAEDLDQSPSSMTPNNPTGSRPSGDHHLDQARQITHTDVRPGSFRAKVDCRGARSLKTGESPCMSSEMAASLLLNGLNEGGADASVGVNYLRGAWAGLASELKLRPWLAVPCSWISISI